MKTKIYCPDIECGSCIKVLNRVLKKLQGIQKYTISKTYLDIEYDESLIQPKHIIQAIKDKGYRAATEPFTRKLLKERAREFVQNKTKYETEYTLLKYIAATLLIFLIVDYAIIYNTGADQYTWWFIYLTIAVVALGAALLHFKTYKTEYTCMVGMMVGMTLGMQTGMLIGAVLGVTNGFFTGALVGMLLASAVGAYTGSCCGIMGIMEGIMAGIMGGTMGAMITVMMANNNLLYFMPPYVVLNLIVLAGLSYMIFEEVVEDNSKVTKKPVSFNKFLTVCAVTLAILLAIMVYTPASVFMGI